MQTTIVTIAAALSSYSMASPVLAGRSAVAPRDVKGACGVHVTQWQKHENGVGSNYKYDITIKDAIGAIIGGVSHEPIADYTAHDITSDVLPYTLGVTSGGIDSDPVIFAYRGYHFSSSSGCSTGGYGGGNRDMDCGFTC
ncbi:hypothetical protein F5Y08DRAFT_336464 [Xylaria arbuscula]|nr:hypothetical protein F5Y08DRAFT_336464 [Xylaria arbuscula]